MSEATLKKTHELLEKLAEYMMNEVPRKSEVATKSELEKLAEYVMNEVPTKREMENRFQDADIKWDKCFQQIENELERKADKRDLEIVKENVQTILNGMDSMVQSLDVIRTEQSAFIAGLRRIENRVEILEKKVV